MGIIFKLKMNKATVIALFLNASLAVKLGSSGVPVYVNPESTLYSNTQAATNFGFTDIPVGLDEVSFLQQQHQNFLNSHRNKKGDEDDEDEDEEIQRLRRQQSNGIIAQHH